MRTSRLRGYALFVCKLMTVACAIGAGTATLAQTTTVRVPSEWAAAMLLDRELRNVGPIDSGADHTIDRTAATARLSVLRMTLNPPDGTLSPLAPAASPTSGSVAVTVPLSLTIGVCVSGTYYNRATALCADGKPPYMLVPLGSIADPAAKMPNVVCTAPKIPTFNSSTKKWACLVPAGFKLSM